MRSLHLNLAAAGLVTVSAWIILHRSGGEDIVVLDGRPASNARGAEVAVSTQNGNGATVMVGARAGPARPDVTRAPQANRQSPVNFAGSAAASGVSMTLPDSPNKAAGGDPVKSGPISGLTHPQSQIRAIQLGEDVRLPAAIVNSADARAGNISAAVTAATKEIENTFYRELAEKAVRKPSVSKDSTAGGPDATAPAKPAVTEEMDYDTVILNEHDVYDAREKADALYRTIHGDAAANRQGISSALEVLLPKDAGPAQP